MTEQVTAREVGVQTEPLEQGASPLIWAIGGGLIGGLAVGALLMLKS